MDDQDREDISEHCQMLSTRADCEYLARMAGKLMKEYIEKGSITEPITKDDVKRVRKEILSVFIICFNELITYYCEEVEGIETDW